MTYIYIYILIRASAGTQNVMIEKKEKKKEREKKFEAYAICEIHSLLLLSSEPKKELWSLSLNKDRWSSGQKKGDGV